MTYESGYMPSDIPIDVVGEYVYYNSIDYFETGDDKSMEYISREDAFALLKKYNNDPFHIQHALTVEAVMRWFADYSGYG